MMDVRAASFGSDWTAWKLLLSEAIGVSKDALHVLLGFAIFVVAALALRQPLRSWTPLLIVFSFELINEALDLGLEGWWDRPMWPGSIKDIGLTMLIPAAVFGLARWRPQVVS